MTHMRRWGAVYVLVALFVGSWLGQFFVAMTKFTNEQAARSTTDQPAFADPRGTTRPRSDRLV